MDNIDILVGRIRKGLNVGADRESIHNAIVGEGKATEEEFFLAFTFAQLVDGEFVSNVE